MPANYVLLEKITVGAAGASSVTFTNIPQTGYTDLVLKVSAHGANSNGWWNLRITLNGTTSGYSGQYVDATGTTCSTVNMATTYIYAGETPDSAQGSNVFNNTELYFPNYTSALYKSYSIDAVCEMSLSTGPLDFFTGVWANNSPITSMEIGQASGPLGQHSTFYLYGIAKLNTTPVIAPFATGGSTIMTDGTYWYHAFKSPGTFTPLKTLSCDVITIAGGGGGGGGGGGAGGLLYSTSQSVTTAQTVTIGAGGGATAQGSNSVFGSLTATGGGGPTFSGGSGGGSESISAGGTGTVGQGNNGGSGITFVTNCGFGGGGGAGAVGGNGTTTTGGVGGAGVNTYSAWASATGTGASGYYAGGGGGGCGTGTTGNGPNAGAGGAGGGAQGGVYVAGLAGTANTGGGGGGSYGTSGGAGGSGIVIVRYSV